jgi:hypothetical protein
MGAIDQGGWERSDDPATRALFGHADAGFVRYLARGEEAGSRSWGSGALADPAIDATLEAIEQAFADAPRPSNDELLHPSCFDDLDVADLYDQRSWRSMPDDAVVYAYAALSGISAAGFRHFIPAYMTWTLRHVGSAEAVADSTVWALTGLDSYDERMLEFARSKLALLDDAQLAACRMFLATMARFTDDAAAPLLDPSA